MCIGICLLGYTQNIYTVCDFASPCARRAWILCIIWPVNQRTQSGGRWVGGFKMFITQQQGNDELMCLMKGFRTYSYNDPHPNSPFSHLFSPKSSGYYVPLRKIPERASRLLILPLCDSRTFHCPFTCVVQKQIY